MRGEEKRGGKRSGEEKRGEEKEGEEYTFRNQQEFMMFLNNVPRVNARTFAHGHGLCKIN